MRGARRRPRRPGIVLALAVSWLALGQARADRIVLRGGGEIHGAVVSEPGADPILVQTSHSPNPRSFRRSQVRQVIREPGVLDEYLSRRAAVAPTAEARYALGQWCEENALSGPARYEYEQAVALDPSFAPAQKELGHVLYDGRWMTYDQRRVAMGMVKVDGRWVSRQQKQALDAREAERAVTEGWVRQLKILRKSIQDGDFDRSREAEEQFLAIDDPGAIPAMLQVFGRAAGSLRVLLAKALGAIDGPEAAEALVRLVLGEDEPIVAQALYESLRRHQGPAVVEALVDALGAADPLVVGRAALALAGLGVVAEVPHLIDALVRPEQGVVMVPRIIPGQSGPTAFFGAMATVPIIAPAVGPAGVAYGATGVPFVANGVGLGGGTPPQVVRVPRVVTGLRRNTDVLEALRQLTGRDFGFDVDSWRQWQHLAFQPNRDRTRRVPQP